MRKFDCARARLSLLTVAALAGAALSAVVAPAAASAAAAPQLARYPYLTDLTDTSVAVNWATNPDPSGVDVSGPGYVTYGPAGGSCADQTVTVAKSTYNYWAFGVNSGPHYHGFTAQLTGLSPSHDYCYRIYSGNPGSGTDLLGDPEPFPTTFTTRPAPGSSSTFSFDVFGDWGETAVNNNQPLTTYNPYQDALDSQLAASTTGPNPALFAIANGDIAYNNGDTTNYGDLNHPADATALDGTPLGGPEWSDVFDARYFGKVGGSLPLYSVTGNHGRNSTFFQTWPTPTNVSASNGTYNPALAYPATGGVPSGTFPSDWYAFTVGKVRFYILDADWSDSVASQYPDLGQGCRPTTGKNCPMYEIDRAEHWQQDSAEYKWLANDLQKDVANRGASALRMAFFHFPLRVDQNNSLTQQDVYLQNSAANPSGAASSLEALLAAGNVNLVFNAHAHMYERNIAPPGGVPSYVSGGGGGVLTNVSKVCSPTDAYARGWLPTSAKGSACGAPNGGGAATPTSPDQVYHFLKVTVSGSTVSVAPTDSDGNVFDATTYNFAPDTTAPSQPGAPTVTPVTNGGVRITLGTPATDNVGVVAYDVYMDGAYQFSLPNGVTSWTVNNVPSGQHVWTARARDQRGNQSLVPPSQPAAAVAGNHAVQVSWPAVTGNANLAGYNVYRDGAQVGQVAAGTSYTDTSVQDLTSYSYTVTAFDTNGNVSPQSPTATITTPDWTAPSTPAQPTATVVGKSVQLTWAASTDNSGVTGYDVYRNGQVIQKVTTGTSFTDAGVRDATTYRYAIDAFDAAGNTSPQSPVATLKTPDWTAPTAPTVSAVAGRAGQIIVRWSGARDNVGVTSYDVYRDGSSRPVVAGVRGSQWTNNVTPGSRHSYRVVARDAARNSSPLSNAAAATAPRIRPTIYINASSQTVHVKQWFHLFGSVVPQVQHVVKVEQYIPSTHRWVVVRTQTTAKRMLNSRWRIGYSVSDRIWHVGTYKFRVYWPGGGEYSAAYSRVMRIYVIR
jgi:fibronectin type 3 domain-containing protein